MFNHWLLLILTIFLPLVFLTALAVKVEPIETFLAVFLPLAFKTLTLWFLVSLTTTKILSPFLIEGLVGATSERPSFGAVKLAASLTEAPTPIILIEATTTETTLTIFFESNMIL